MENKEIVQKRNPLEYESIGRLIAKYSVPAIISSLVSSIYNIVDQIFIGQSLGAAGNAATNVAFPLVLVMVAVSMTFGSGASSAFSLYLGEGEKSKASKIVGNSLFLTIVSGILLGIIALVFLRPLMVGFGGRGQVLEYAVEYTRIIAIGTPFALLGSGASQLIRADGSPRYAMAATLSGAVLNCILDPIFIFGLDMGMSGAAYATIIGQGVSAVMIVGYFFRFKSVKLKKKDFLLAGWSTKRMLSLGVAAGANQVAITIVQIVMNNTLGHYGELSQYGRDIPLACVGVISKVSVIFNSCVFGISQSTQPIIGFNYGSQNYPRVREAFKKAAVTVTVISVAAFLCFQIFPRQIISIFGKGDALYYEFALRYFHIFLFCTFINGVQILASNFFPSIGKGALGMIVSLSRQVFFLLPLIVIFPLIWGIDGVLWAGPIADGIAGILAIVLVRLEMRKWPHK